MRVEDLALESFRNYARAEVAFAPGLNLVVGRNAQGKTNLLEAVYVLSGLGSPRGPDASVVMRGAERALLHATVHRGPEGKREVRVDLELRPGRAARALVNRTPVPSARSLGEALVAVYFGPDELALVKGSPDGRRRMLDDIVVKLRPARHELRREWERVLKQRNALLRSAPRGAPVPATLDVWDDAMCRAGGALAAARLDALAALIPHARRRFEAIAGDGRIELSYQSAWLDPETAAAAVSVPGSVPGSALVESLRAAVAQARPRELERGMSLVGPQRDDMAVLVATTGEREATEARTFASQGEQRTSALALKLGEYDLLAADLGEGPVLLLDDVFSELDPFRRSWLADAVRATGQTIMTSAEPGAAEAAAAERVFEVTGGEVKHRER